MKNFVIKGALMVVGVLFVLTLPFSFYVVGPNEYAALFEFGKIVSIIDTPGMREIGMAKTEEGIDNTFSDILELSCMCKFSDCKHESEPGCAVRAAIERGELSEERLELYRNLGRENVRNYAKKKEISKWAKKMKNVPMSENELVATNRRKKK